MIWRGAEGLRVAGFGAELGAAFAGTGLAAEFGVSGVFTGAGLAGAVFAATGLAGAGFLAGAFAFAAAGFAFAGAAFTADFAVAGFFAGVLSFAMTRPFRFRPLFAVAAISPISLPKSSLFLCAAQKSNTTLG